MKRISDYDEGVEPDVKRPRSGEDAEVAGDDADLHGYAEKEEIEAVADDEEEEEAEEEDDEVDDDDDGDDVVDDDQAVQEPRLTIEKQPAVLWSACVNDITVGRQKQAEAKLSKVRVAINEVIATSELSGFPIKATTWKRVLLEVDGAVHAGPEAVTAYKIMA